MTPPQKQDRAAARTIPTDLDLALIARANARGAMRPTDDDLVVLRRAAEILGCGHAVAKIRETADRRAARAALTVAPPPAPRGGRPPAATPPRSPLLGVIQGGGETERAADPWDTAMGSVVHGMERALEVPGLSASDRAALVELRLLARLAGRLPARELREADPGRPPA